jgi:hypothetical protein
MGEQTVNRDRFRHRSDTRLLKVAETQLARLAADGDEASAKALWRYVERDLTKMEAVR